MLIKESIENVLSPIVRKAFRYSTQKTLYKYERQIEAEIVPSKLECGRFFLKVVRRTTESTFIVYHKQRSICRFGLLGAKRLC